MNIKKNEDPEKAKKMYLLKKQIHHLKNQRGSGTELISVYIPSEAQIHETSNKLKGEAGQASNIKSKSTRKNVTDALERIVHHLKSYGNNAPASGIAIFCGNISDNPAKTDIDLFTIFPPEQLHIQTYRCDSRFFVEPLEGMLEIKESYGLVVMDGRECTIASLKGTQIRILHRLNSTAHAKIRKGGQCLAPDTMICPQDGSLQRVSEISIGTNVKGVDLSDFKIDDFCCADKFFTESKIAFELTTTAPKMQITATAWHRFFTIDKYGAREIYAKDLKIGDRVLIAKRITHEGKNIRIEYKPREILVLDKKEFQKLKRRRNALKLSQKQVAEKMGISQMAICRMENGEIQLSEKNIKKMYNLYNLEFDGEKFSTTKIKLQEFYDGKLAYLLGYIAGDGSLDKNRICIYEGHEQLAKKITKVAYNSIGILPKIYEIDKRSQKGSFAKKIYYEIRIFSKDFAQFIENEIPQIVAESNKRAVPEQILKSKLDVQAAFLSGLFDAEGYLHGKRVEIAMCTEQMMRQIQMMLLRFSIQSSFGEKPVKGNRQWYVSISDFESVKKFATQIGFSRKDKKEAISKIVLEKTNQQPTNQVPVDGQEVYAYAKSIGLRTSDFHAASMFFRNLKPLGINAFKKKIAPVLQKRAQEVARVEQTQKNIDKWISSDISIATIARKKEILGKREYVDLTIPNAFNFVANGFIVHNSAARYARLIEEAIEVYYKRIGEYMDKYFVNTVNGVILGGPGPAKENFIKMKPFNYQIKMLGVVDTGYTEEQGLRELMDKSKDLIADQQAIVEKELIDKFIKQVVSNGLAVYGEANVRKVLKSKQASTLIISEDLEWTRYHVRINGEEQYLNKRTEDGPPKTAADGSKITVLSKVDLSDDLIEMADAAGVAVKIVSSETTEGAQFFQSFYGIGALLRYR